MEKINLHSLVLMVGPSGSGKSTLAAKHFEPHEIVSSDGIRAELLGDFRIQTNQFEVWEEVHRRVRQRLAFGQRVVVDATNIKFGDRRAFVDMAKHFGVELVYLVINRTVDAKLKTAGWRLEVNGLIERHEEVYNNNLKEIMRGDGVARVIKLFDNTELEVVKLPLECGNTLVSSTVNRVNQVVNKPVTVVGDVHGNINELDVVVAQAKESGNHLLFLGDIVDYGYFNLTVMETVYDLMRTGQAHMIWGNHERKLDRWVNADFGRFFKGVIGPGLALTIKEIHDAVAANPAFKDRFIAKWRFLAANCRQHFVLGDRYMFTHGAASKEMWNMLNKHSLFGEHQNMAFFGQVDATVPMRQDGMPNRVYNWIDDIPTGKTVVVGHDPRSKNEPFIATNANGGTAVFLDTGCSKGGKLSTMTIRDFDMV